MSGESRETVLGALVTISIAGSVFKLKRIWNLTKDHPVTRDANSDNVDYTFGRPNHGFSITIEASTPDLPTIDGWTDEDASGDLTELAIIISMPNVNDDTPITASFNCKFHHSELGHPSVLSKVLIRLDGKITSKKVTWA